MEEIYRSETLLVRKVPGADRTRWIIAFDHFQNERGFDREGFGEAFLRREGLSAIHMLCADNSWYQYPDTLRACAAIREATAGAERVVALGSSMGAYAAIRLAKKVGANATLALSPQYSLHPAKAPWERRWTQYRDAIGRSGWVDEVDGPIESDVAPYVTFDPADTDSRHIDQIEREIPIHRIALPYSGHPSTGYLAEIGMLWPLLRAVYDGNDPIALMQAARRNRRTSSYYLGLLAGSQPPHRLRTAIRLAEQATLRQPDSPIGYHNLAKLMTRAGRHTEAIAIHRKVADITGRAGAYLPEHADALAAAGDYHGAAAIAKEAAAIFPEAGHIHHWHADLLWHANARDAALAAARRAVAIDPRPDYVERAARYEDALTRPLLWRPSPAARRPAWRHALVKRLIGRIARRSGR